MITFDDFSKVEIRVGKVVEAEDVVGSNKLIRLRVDFGDYQRMIFTGVRKEGFTVENFQDKQFLFVTNLEYKKIMDQESQGMILAVEGNEDKPIFIEVGNLPVGAKVK